MVTVEATFTKEEIINNLTPESPFMLFGVSWEDYEEILQELWGTSIKVQFNRGVLKIMAKSPRHEYFISFTEQLIGILSRYLRQKVIFFGSPTIKREAKQKGAEPDACFYVGSANLVSGKIDIDAAEILPDVVLEIDVTHKSSEKFETYAAFGVKEFWLYDQRNLRIYRLHEGEYKEVEASAEIPRLTGRVLTEYLNRSQMQDQFEVLLDFEKWLQENE